jgi:hypothetical protein
MRQAMTYPPRPVIARRAGRWGRAERRGPPPARRGNLGAGGRGVGRGAWLGARACAPRILLWWGTPFSYAKRGSPPGPPSSKNVCAFMGRGCRPLVLGASPLAMGRPLWCGPAPAVRGGGEWARGLLPLPLTKRGRVGERGCPLAKKGRGQGPRCWWAGGTGGGRLPRRSLAPASRNDKAGRWGLGVRLPRRSLALAPRNDKARRWGWALPAGGPAGRRRAWARRWRVSNPLRQAKALLPPPPWRGRVGVRGPGNALAP